MPPEAETRPEPIPDSLALEAIDVVEEEVEEV
jgi:hypothetical protein